MTLFDGWPPEVDELEQVDDRQATSTARPFEHLAHARRSDPATSHEAAASLSIDALTASQHIALDLLEHLGPSTLEQVVDEAHAREVPLSDSRIRSAVAELVDVDLVHDTGERRPTRSRRTGRVLAAGPAPTKEHP